MSLATALLKRRTLQVIQTTHSHLSMKTIRITTAKHAHNSEHLIVPFTVYYITSKLQHEVFGFTLQVGWVLVVGVVSDLQLLTDPHLTLVAVSLEQLVRVRGLQVISSLLRGGGQIISALSQRHATLRHLIGSVVLITHQTLSNRPAKLNTDIYPANQYIHIHPYIHVD